jgi:hypothetical protein
MSERSVEWTSRIKKDRELKSAQVSDRRKSEEVSNSVINTIDVCSLWTRDWMKPVAEPITSLKITPFQTNLLKRLKAR